MLVFGAKEGMQGFVVKTGEGGVRGEDANGRAPNHPRTRRRTVEYACPNCLFQGNSSDYVGSASSAKSR